MKKQNKKQDVGCPFIGPDGQVHSPLRAILDRCIIWQIPAPNRVGNGLIELPQTVMDQFQDGTGILLSIGPGYYGKKPESRSEFISRRRAHLPANDKIVWNPTPDQLKPGVRVLFDNTVPWYVISKDRSGKEHKLIICGVMDIQGVVV